MESLLPCRHNSPPGMRHQLLASTVRVCVCVCACMHAHPRAPYSLDEDDGHALSLFMTWLGCQDIVRILWAYFGDFGI